MTFPFVSLPPEQHIRGSLGAMSALTTRGSLSLFGCQHSEPSRLLNVTLGGGLGVQLVYS